MEDGRNVRELFLEQDTEFEEAEEAQLMNKATQHAARLSKTMVRCESDSCPITFSPSLIIIHFGSSYYALIKAVLYVYFG